MGYYDKAIDWLQKSVQLQPTLWFSRVHLISAYSLAKRQQEAQAALSEFRGKFKNWELANIKDWYDKRFLNHGPALEAILSELFNGLQAAGLEPENNPKDGKG